MIKKYFKNQTTGRNLLLSNSILLALGSKIYLIQDKYNSNGGRRRSLILKNTSKMNFTKSTITTTIKGLRAKLYQQLTAPIDAMWELLYIASAQHYLIEADNNTLGYCCINEAGCLIQLFLEADARPKMSKVIKTLIDTKLIKTAALSSNEPLAFNTCLFHSTSIKTNTFCFEHPNKTIEVSSPLNIELVTTKDIPTIKSFLKEQVGMDDTFGYTENLIARKELFMVQESGVIIATSERRISDTQSEIADVGIIVKKDYQGRGIATKVMQMQVNRILKEGRKPICSTTVVNIASQKAIKRAGFYCSNIIFDIGFSELNIT